jgi:hypothetical protein
MTGQLRDPTKITNESWRAKAYGLVEEGRKFRVSNAGIRHAAWMICVAISAIQLYSAFKPSFQKSTESLFAPPSVRTDTPPTYVPPIMDARRDAEMSKEQEALRARSRPLPIIERIKPINLAGFHGIPAGSEVGAQLISGGANGMVKAQLVENLKGGGEELLPKGTVLIGKGSSSDDRLYIAFKRAVRPDGESVKIAAQAYDSKDRIVGLKGKKISDYAFRLATSAGLIFLGGVADGMRGDSSQNPFYQKRPTMREAALNGVSTATADMSRQQIEAMNNSQERVVVEHSTKLIVIFGDSDGD